MIEKDIEVKLEKSKLTMRGKVFNPNAKHVALCWHGWLDNCMSFDKLARALPELKIIALDIPGHGKSDHIPEGMVYLYHLFMLWASEWIESTKEDEIILLGHSLGATVFSMVAPLFPKKVKSFISIDSLGPLSSEKGELVSKMEASFRSYMELNDQVTPIKHPYEKVIKIRAHVENISEKDSALLCSRDIYEKDGKHYWSTDKRLKLRSPHYFYESQIEEYFSKNESQNLIIMGKSGLVQKYDKSHRVKSLKKHVVVELEGGHHVHIEHPDAVANTIRDWLEI